MSSYGDSSDHDRTTWPNKLEYQLSVLSYILGLCTFWRFPYLAYDNGGGECNGIIVVLNICLHWLNCNLYYHVFICQGKDICVNSCGMNLVFTDKCLLTLWEPPGFGNFRKKNSGSRLPYQRPSSSAHCARELFSGSNGSASLVDCTRIKIFCLGGAFFLSDVISGRHFGPLCLALGANH